jgi:Uma2 family endonuclease
MIPPVTTPARKVDDLIAELAALPGNVKGEIIDGVLYTQPRPRPRHARFASALERYVGGPFDLDDDGPGGWVILVEPGIELPGAPEVAPDLAGWRRERFKWPEEDQPLRLAPDWVCEVLSPSNKTYDRSVKFPFYARMGIEWLWIVEPREHTVDVQRLVQGNWTASGKFSGADAARLEPFAAVEIPLGRLWV